MYHVTLTPQAKENLLKNHRPRLMELFGRSERTIIKWFHDDDPALTQHGALLSYSLWLHTTIEELTNVKEVK